MATLRMAHELVQIIIDQGRSRYGDEFPADELRDLMPLLLEQITTVGKERFLPEESAHSSISDDVPGYDIKIGSGWFYNVSDSWLEIVVSSVPLLFSTVLTGGLAVAALPMLIPLVKNLKKIPRDSQEYTVYNFIADYVGTHKVGPTLPEVQDGLSLIAADSLQTSLNQLVFEYRVIRYANGKYVPGV